MPAARHVAERRGLSGARGRAGFDQMQMDRLVEIGVMRLRGTQDVGGEAPVPGAGFHEIEIWNLEFRIQNSRDFRELHFEQLAEQRADIDAGKIARAAGALGRGRSSRTLDRRARDP